MVLHDGSDYFIARIQEFFSKGRSDKVKRFGCPFGKNDLMGVSCIYKITDHLPGLFIGFRCLQAQVMNPAMNIAIVVLIIIPYRLNYLFRLLRGGSIVEIYQRPVIYLLMKYREIRPYFINWEVQSFINYE